MNLFINGFVGALGAGHLFIHLNHLVESGFIILNENILIIHHDIDQQFMIVFSLLFIVEQRQLVEPHVQHLFQLFIADFILANDLAQS